MIRWYLARHGRTTLNRYNRVQGHSQTSLDEQGMAQARNLHDRLVKIEFTAAFSSDLLRAQQTAEIILNNRQITIDTSSDLRELNYGLWEGLNIEDIQNRHNDEFNRFMNSELDFAPPEGESVTHLIERTGRFVEQLQGQVTEGNLLVVCHGGSLRGLVVNLLKMPADMFWNLMVDQASLSLVDVYPNRAVLKLFNDTSHLEDIV